MKNNKVYSAIEENHVSKHLATSLFSFSKLPFKFYNGF